MRDEEDLYAILQVHPAAEPEIVEAAYRRLARMYHPDVNKSPHAHTIMTRINRAYEILKDPSKRAQYDLERAYWQRQVRPDAEGQTQAERARREQSERQARAERTRREQAQRQAQAERRQREQYQREQREQQVQYGNARQSYSEWEDERSDVTQKLPIGLSILKGIASGILFGVIAGVILIPFNLVGWSDAGEFIVLVLDLVLSLGTVYMAIAGPFTVPSSGIRCFVRIVGNIMFLLISFVVMILAVGLLGPDASNIIIFPTFSFFLGAALGFLASLYFFNNE